MSTVVIPCRDRPSRSPPCLACSIECRWEGSEGSRFQSQTSTGSLQPVLRPHPRPTPGTRRLRPRPPASRRPRQRPAATAATGGQRPPPLPRTRSRPAARSKLFGTRLTSGGPRPHPRPSRPSLNRGPRRPSTTQHLILHTCSPSADLFLLGLRDLVPRWRTSSRPRDRAPGCRERP